MKLLDTARKKWLADEHESALSLFRDAVKVTPADMRLAVEFANYLGLRFEIEEASTILQRCEQQLAGNVEGLYQIGLAYDRGFQPDQALRCYQNAVRVDPNHDRSWIKIAEWEDRRGLLDDAANSIAQCSRDVPELQLARAKLLRRQQRFAESENLLFHVTAKESLDKSLRVEAWYELAGIYDRQGRSELAFDAAIKAKQIQHDAAISQLRRAQELARIEANFVSSVTTDHYRRWASDENDPSVALLTGSPRSGTTLMARALGQHPSIQLADEINAYATYIHREMLAGTSGDNAGQVLDSIAAEHLAKCKSRYLRWMYSAVQCQDQTGVLLDKNPSTTFLIPAFRRLFPQSVIIIAIRDPRDVIVSCFLQYFPLNPVSAMFTRLDLTVMRCCAEVEAWLRLRDKLTTPWCEIRYEELASGNVEVLRRALEAMEVPWQDGLTNFQSGLRNSPVRSPTYPQLFESVHTRSIGRWKAYEEWLSPYFEKLLPVCRALGFE